MTNNSPSVSPYDNELATRKPVNLTATGVKTYITSDLELHLRRYLLKARISALASSNFSLLAAIVKIYGLWDPVFMDGLTETIFNNNFIKHR